MATLTELIENVVSIKKHIDVYAALPRLNPKQTAALRTNLGQLGKNLAALAAYIETPSQARALAPDEKVEVPPEWFHDLDDESVVYLAGGSPGNPNGVSFTYGTAKEWWTYVFASGLNISRIRPTLMPGSSVLSSEGVAAARALGIASVNYAPEDFNPLGLEVIA